MRNYIKIFVLAAVLSVVACNKEVPSCEELSSEVELAGAHISTRVEEGGVSSPSSVTLFAEGDVITVVGAAEDNVSFIYLDNDTWRVDRPYQWIETPSIVSAYYKTGVVVENDKQLPEFYVAKKDCSTDKVLSFTGDNSFKHATALIRVEVNNWQGLLPPQSVELSDFHKVTYITEGGEYQKGDELRSISMELTSTSGNTYVYEARVPAGDAVNTNIESGYKILVDGVNVLDWEVDETKIAAFYPINEVYTYTLNY